MEYRTVVSRDDIDEEVNELIAEGWEPLGGVSISCYYVPESDAGGHFESGSRTIYAQAMVKRGYAPTESEG